MKGVVFLIVLTNVALGENAGIRTRITQKAIEFFTDSNQILSMLPEIPDFADSTEIAVLGKVDYKLYDIKINNLHHLPKYFLAVKPDIGLSWRGGELHIAVQAKWIYDTHSLIPISDSGKVKVKITVESTPFVLKLGADKSGRLKVNMAERSCHFSVEEVDIELEGGKEWLYNLFESNVEEMLKKAANKEICGMISNMIRNNLAATLSTMEVIAPLVPDVLSLDLSLLADPAFTSFIDLSHSGEVFDVNSRSKVTQDFPQLPTDSKSSHMFYMWLTDYMLNSAGRALQSSGHLRYRLTQEELPENGTFQLNTSGYELSLLFPLISKLYPDKEVHFDIYPSSPPSVQLMEEAVELVATINIELHIIGDDLITAHIATMKNILQLTGNLGIEDSKLTWSLSSFSCKSELLKSEVKDLDFDIIDSALSFASHAFIKQYIKDKGSEGIPLSDLGGGWKVTNPSIQQGKGFVKIGIDLERQ